MMIVTIMMIIANHSDANTDNNDNIGIYWYNDILVTIMKNMPNRTVKYSEVFGRLIPSTLAFNIPP